jgi:TolB-like protein
MSNSDQNNAFDKVLSNGDNIFTNSGLGMKKNNVLHSWKDISAYLDRDVRTCYRWEAEFGLPVHRIDENSPRSKVFAYPVEIDEWLKERSKNGKYESILPKRKNKWIIAGLAAGFVVLAIVFTWIYLIAPASIPSLSEPTLAVFPFKNLNSSEYDAYFSEGITNEIRSGLIRLNKIKVIPAIVNDFDDNQELGADYLVFGELWKDRDKIRITVNLIRVKDRKNIWSEQYDSDQEEIFSLKENICQKIHEKIGFEVDEALLVQSAMGATRDYAAYDTYLKGNFLLKRMAEQEDDPWMLCHQGKYYVGRCTQESNELAISLFNQAIAIDKYYAQAYIGLAQCFSNYVNMNWDTDIEWLTSAESLLEEAQKISPGLPEYYTTLIKICRLKEISLNKSMSDVVFDLAKEAIEKYPYHPQLNSITGYCYLGKYGESGDEADFENALKFNERSFLLNPSSLNNIKYAELLMIEKEFYQAIEVCLAIERADPSLFSKFMLGEIYYFMGDLEKSREIFLDFDMPMHFKIHSLYYLAMIEAQRGEREKALGIVREIEIMKPEEYRDLPFQFEMASIFFGIGDEEVGFRYLESLFADGQAKNDRFIYAKFAEIDKNFDNFRNEQRFQKLFQGDF